MARNFSSVNEGEIVIHDGNEQENQEAIVDGELKGKGGVPRPYDAFPVGCYKSAPMLAVDFPLIDPATYPERIKDRVANKSQLSDLRLVGNNGGLIDALDQNGKGYCWAHSGVSAVTMLRMVMNAPYVPLSAYAVACIIKSYRDEGGWGAQGLDFLTERGVPSQEFWPNQSMSRGNDKPETWANAAKHKVTNGWVDLGSGQYDRNLSFNQVVTLCLSGIPVITDFNWWSHSVCAIDAVMVTASKLRMGSGKKAPQHIVLKTFEVTGGIGLRILNSWGNSWSQQGTGVLAGNKAIPDGATAPYTTLATAA